VEVGGVFVREIWPGRVGRDGAQATHSGPPVQGLEMAGFCEMVGGERDLGRGKGG
jgi:hypothetical protein